MNSNAVLLCLALMFMAGSVSAQAPTKQTSPSTPGRFQLVQLGDSRTDQYLLDTQTGRVWHTACATPSETAVNKCAREMFDELEVSGLRDFTRAKPSH